MNNTENRLTDAAMIDQAEQLLYREAENAGRGEPVNAENIRAGADVLASLARGNYGANVVRQMKTVRERVGD